MKGFIVPMIEKKKYKAPEKRIIGGERAFQVQPVKYPEAAMAFKNSLSNFWSPDEVSMGEDILSFRELTSAENHMFIHTFMTLSAMDMFAADTAVEGIKSYITSPEHQLFLGKQIFDECVHTQTYALAIEMLSLDAEYIWHGWKTIPAINNKIVFAQEILANLKQSLDMQNPEDIKLFLTTYFFFAGIFEGAWFYNGFSPIFSLTANGKNKSNGLPKMLRTKEQLEWIVRDEAMHYGFGLNTIAAIVRETGVQPDKSTIKTLCNEAFELEKAYAEFILPEPMVGYNSHIHTSAAKYFINARAQRAFGYTVWDDATVDPVPWLQAIIIAKREKNFFETRVMEYKTNVVLEFEDPIDWNTRKAQLTTEDLLTPFGYKACKKPTQ